MAESTGGRTLVVFDFDWSLVDNNTDTWITILGGEKAASLQSQFGTDGFRHSCWTDLMEEILKIIHEENVTQEELEAHLGKIVIHKNMQAALRLIRDRSDVDCFVLSDSNTVFIDVVLRHYKLRDVVKRIVSNPAAYDPAGRLHVRHTHSHTCGRCPENLCKGFYLDGFLSSNAYKKVVYVGDGGNDVCPSLRLSSRDTVLARDGYALPRRLARASGLKASMVKWKDGTDILQWFTDNL